MKQILKSLSPKQKLFIIVTFIICLTGSFITGVYVKQSQAQNNSALSPINLSESAYATPNPTPTITADEVKQKDQLNILLLGYGGAGHQGGYLTDVMILMHIDTIKNTIRFISIPRDLYLTMHDGVARKINTALSLGQKEEYPTHVLTKDQAENMTPYVYAAINQVTGYQPDYFIGIDFSGFQTLIDDLGGLDVNVPHDFIDEYYPIKGKELELCDYTPEEVTAMSATMSGFTLEKQFKCRYETLNFHTGTMKMDGSTALKFVRSRHSAINGGDFVRSQRQYALLIAIKNIIFSPTGLQNIGNIYQTSIQNIRTNIDQSVTTTIVDMLKDISSYKIDSVQLSTGNVLVNSTSNIGAYILIPKEGMDKWQQVKAYISQ